METDILQDLAHKFQAEFLLILTMIFAFPIL